MIDFDRLDEVLAFMEAHPKQADQWRWFSVEAPYRDWRGKLADDWQCGTVACLAGWTAILAGWVPTDSHSPLVSYAGRSGPRLVSDVAQDLLGLTAPQADWLFHGAEDTAMVRHLVELLRQHPAAAGPEIAAWALLTEVIQDGSNPDGGADG